MHERDAVIHADYSIDSSTKFYVDYAGDGRQLRIAEFAASLPIGRLSLLKGGEKPGVPVVY